ncbi:hypothetical protein [Paraburkholderia unamae]|uniref:Uncharacterized protein n=1 Tax=Paraburkholderia unamae TaxID=219649 RepID=A0ACC6RML1_9BURK
MLIDVKPLLRQLRAAEHRRNAEQARIRRFTRHPLVVAARDVAPALEARLEAPLLLTEFHEIVRRAHSRDIEKIFELTNAVFAILIRFAFYANALADDFRLVPGDWTHDAQLRADLIHENEARIDVQVAQPMHHPLGFLLAVYLDEARHDGRIFLSVRMPETVGRSYRARSAITPRCAKGTPSRRACQS